MLTSESNYAFRKRLEQVHRPDIRLKDAAPESNEAVVDDTWRIVLPPKASPFVLRTAQDLQDYLAVSQGVFVAIRPADRADASASAVIRLGTASDFPQLSGAMPEKPRGYRLIVAPKEVIVCGKDERGMAQGCYRLEDVMNLRLAPFLPCGDQVREPLFAPRMVHSGWGNDVFPDNYLKLVAHAGIDALLVFVKGINLTHTGYLDFNDLIERAEAQGLDVYFYSYFKNRMHPDDPGAEAYYDGIYGDLIRHFPKVKGIVFVGESCEFPTKDEHAKGWLRLDPPPPGHEHDKRPSPGWYPCRDYPQWLDVVKRVMRRHKPDLDIIFWTYNWGYQPEAPRLDLIRHLPTDISLQVTFEMFENVEKEGVMTRCVDYTASFAGPGHYFSSEAQEAAKRGIPLYAMSNTGGLTWDIGVIPYEPIPYQWHARWTAMEKARREWGLRGLMESHHYGWWPSFVSELSKEQFWSNAEDFDAHIARIAQRDFGAEGAADALAAWKAWSDAFRLYPPTNQDQYGPFRIGPAYPLLFQGQETTIPAVPYAHHGNIIVTTRYIFANPERVDGEIRLLEHMKALMEEGLARLQAARRHTPTGRADDADYMLNLGDYIVHCVQTTINTKKWYQLDRRLSVDGGPRAAREELCRRMLALAEEEKANAEAAIPCVERDSRLGWEPTMEYLGDAEHIRWKLALLQDIIDSRIPGYLSRLG